MLLGFGQCSCGASICSNREQIFFSISTYLNCQNHCEEKGNCVGIDWKEQPNECFLILDTISDFQTSGELDNRNARCFTYAQNGKNIFL